MDGADKIYSPRPCSIEYAGQTWTLNMSFRCVLEAMDAMRDGHMTEQDKIDFQLDLLVRPGYRKLDYTQRAELLARIYDFIPKGEKLDGEKYMDLHQDAALIRSGFFRTYGIDLTESDMHIQQFLELLADLPSDTAFMRTVALRRQPIPEPTKYNQKQIEALQKAKAKVALKISAEERERLFAESLRKISVPMK